MTAIALLRFLEIHGLEGFKSRLSNDLIRELDHHCRKNKLGERWFVDIYDALRELCNTVSA
jgi:hypothetical protein